MTKLVSIIGATGIQGGSVIKALLNDESYTVRAITRDKTSAAAKSLLEKGVEVVEANLNDIHSLETAFSGSFAIFAATNFFQNFPSLSAEAAIEEEVAQGINLAKAAIATPTLEHFIWSTLPNASRVSEGKSFVPHFAGKNKVDDYIKSHAELFRKTTFLWVGFYASNLQYPFFTPFPVTSAAPNKHIQLLPAPSSTPLSLAGDARTNVGLFVHAILEQPSKTLPGKFVLAVTDVMSTGNLLSLWASTKKKEAEYIVVDRQTYCRLWPKWGEVMEANFAYFDLAGDRSYGGEKDILTKDDLGVLGLVDTAKAIDVMEF
ncbi:nitrogen metabolic regulation nmr [Fusarium beomiforme]|uniref:Nitrogen metabolic regulation nmr n=1 Tax=Fusarium beomiforme TaxID=44412 RepID=A0A9P5DTW2_9HYPO|nr:nitrogen metabolic regulation nmr [Fusarium beomiforme]